MEALLSHPDPFLLRCMQFYIIATGALSGVWEISGKSYPYSKFAVPASSQTKKKQFSGRVGMLITYTPALLLSTTFLFYNLHLSFLTHFNLHNQQQHPSLRLLLYTSALSLHFWKRFLEVLFVHQYSGSMEQLLSITFSVLYMLLSGCSLYAQQIAENLSPPSLNLMSYGVPIYLAGIVGNFYHHYLLARLRTSPDSNRRYMIPRGGLFSFVVCPHYLFEIMDFMGLALIGQTATAFAVALSVTMLLSGRARSTKEWYMRKFEGFPSKTKALIPLLF